MVTIGKYNGDINCWGLSHNDFHRGLMQVPENVDVQLNSTNNNDPLVLKSGSMFYIWGSSGITISANSSGNASYPAGSTYDYFRPSAVYTSTDFTVNWSSTQITSTGGNGTYYMTCKGGVDSTSLGRGQIDYLMSSVFTPAFNRSMSGWYGTTAGSTEWRALARFTMTAGVMSRACVFIDHELPAGYISNINVFSTGTNVYLSPFTADLGNNKAVQYLQEINLGAIASLTASTWYSVGINETDYTVTNSSNAGSFSDWTITGNRLNAYSIYNRNFNYCRATISSTVHRILDIYMPSSGSTNIPYSFQLYQVPKTNIYLSSTSTTTFTVSVYSSPEMSKIEYDLLSNFSTATSFYTVTAKSNELQLYQGHWLWNPTSYIVTNAWFFQAQKRGTTIGSDKVANRSILPALSTAIFPESILNSKWNVTQGDIVDVFIYAPSTGGNVGFGSTVFQWIEIVGL